MTQDNERDEDTGEITVQTERKPVAPGGDEDDKPDVSRDDDTGEAVIKLSRGERRVREAKSRLDSALKERDAQWQSRFDRLEAQISATRAAPVNVPQPQHGEDPHIGKLRGIWAEQERITYLMRDPNMTEVDRQRLREEWYGLEGRKETLRIEEIDRRNEDRRSREPRQSSYEEQVLRQEFPEVINNPHALKYAIGEWERMQAIAARDGKPITLEMQKEAVRKAGEAFGIPGYGPHAPAPTRTQQARFASVPTQAGTKAQGGEVRLTKEQQRMAEANWPELKPNDAYVLWAKKWTEESKRASDE